MDSANGTSMPKLMVQVLLMPDHDPIYSWVWRVVTKAEKVLAEGVAVTAHHAFEEATNFARQHELTKPRKIPELSLTKP